MQLTLIRNRFSEKATIGELTIDDNTFKCFVLEDKDRGLQQQSLLPDILRQKVFGETAIPYGCYEIAITWSERFKKLMPQLLHVPGFEGVRIHPGNTDADTEGCLLTAYTTKGDDFIGESQAAFSVLHPILQAACAKEKVFITLKKAL